MAVGRWPRRLRAMGSASPRPARNGVGMALRRVFAPAFQAAESVLFIHWRVVAAPRGGPAISFLWNDGGAGRAMGSASPRPARNGVGMALRRVFAPAFQAAESVLFIHWRVVAAPRGGPAISFYGMTAALAELWGQRRRDRLATAWGWLAGSCSLSIGGVGRSRSARQFRRLAPAITFLWNDGGAGRAMGSASPRPARTGVGMGRRRVFSLDFPGW